MMDNETTFYCFDENFNLNTLEELKRLKEPEIEILNPDGHIIVKTNNELVFDWFRLQIKKNKLEGYKIRTKDNNIYSIFPDGSYNTVYTTFDEYPGFEHMKIVMDLL